MSAGTGELHRFVSSCACGRMMGCVRAAGKKDGVRGGRGGEVMVIRINAFRRKLPGTRIHVTCVALFLYFSANLLLRWISTELERVTWGAAVGWFEKFSACLVNLAQPLALCLALFACSGFFRRSWKIALASAFVLLMFIEADMNWYFMSHEHIQWRDVVMFATEGWFSHFGLKPADLVSFAKLAVVHVLGLFAIAAVVHWFASREADWDRPRPSWLALGAALLLFAAGKAAFVLSVVEGNEYLKETVRKNPMYVSVGDDDIVYHIQRRNFPLLDRINDAIAGGNAAASAAPTGSEVRHDFVNANVLVIAVESWNKRLALSGAMPFLDGLGAKCVQSENHFSLSNITLLSVVGLLNAEPVTILDTKVDAPLVVLRKAGYNSAGMGGNLTSSAPGKFKPFVAQFTDGFEELGQDDWIKIDPIVKKLQGERQFVYAHYWGTHFWYKHKPEYSKFLPELSANAPFFGGNPVSHREKVINRYKNTLVELDHWLATLLAKVDMRKTIVVITGDHGEEMYETGRLAHGSSLDDPQVQVPLLVCLPNGARPTVQKKITSHADIFPTIFDLIGIEYQDFGVRSIFQAGAGDFAVIAENNNVRPPRAWRVVTASGGDALITRGNGQLLKVRSYRLPTEGPQQGEDVVAEIVNAGIALVRSEGRGKH